jgi:predicted Rossmann fold flavoprotein
MKIVIIGGGAAGFFGAITCAETYPEHEVILLEKSRSVLSKVRVSGGGRCNVTHACFNNRQMAQHYPRGNQAMPALLKQFDAAQTVQWFESRGVKLKTEADGRMFPTTDSSETIIQCLTQAAYRAGVQVRTSVGVKSISVHQESAPRFSLALLDGSTIHCDRVLVATGGHPQAQGYDWLTQPHPTGEPHTIELPVPSLFTFHTPTSLLLALAGISVPKAVVKVVGTKLVQEGALLITHWGFSGPAVLKLSAWGARDLHEKDYRFTLLVNWLPDLNDENLRQDMNQMRDQHPKKTVMGAHTFFGLPQRLWRQLVGQAGIGEETRWSELPKKQMNQLIEQLLRSSFAVAGKSTFKEEFVTCGGVSLDNLDLQTMESRHCKGLYFAGEVLNIDGVTGGFNFQSAWSTGFIAGKHIGRKEQ